MTSETVGLYLPGRDLARTGALKEVNRTIDSQISIEDHDKNCQAGVESKLVFMGQRGRDSLMKSPEVKE